MKTKYERFIPEGYVQFKPELGDYPKDMFACYVNAKQKQPVAIFYAGKQSKPTWHYRFNSIEELQKKINESIKRLMSWHEMKEDRKLKKKEDISKIKVGDLFSSSWGYEQTNVDFYQVVSVKGKSFTIKQIKSRTIDGSEKDYNGMADRRCAVKDAFLDEEKYPPMTKRSLKLTSYSWLSPTTENEPHYCSWYA